jgi:hypothetical protein
MENLFIEQDVKTPKLHFDYAKGELLIEGVSVPENTIEFYSQYVFWIKEYVQESKKTVFNIKLEYFNTSTSVVLLNMLRELAVLGPLLTINWYYETGDEEMREQGEDYEKMLEIPFHFLIM